MQGHYDLPTFKRIDDLPIGREPSSSDGRGWTIGQHTLDAVMRRLATKAEEANGRKLMGTKGGGLRVQVND